MNTAHLNEHDANQGAQSSGEFLGMTGNSGWYLLGSGGATILMVILLWGILGISLLLCLFVGIVLCLLSLAYVFALKNNKPEHYDTDFFESALIEAGVCELSFGPQARRLTNPFTGADARETVAPAKPRARHAFKARSRGVRGKPAASVLPAIDAGEAVPDAAPTSERSPVVAQAAYEELEERLHATEELLEDAWIEREEGRA